MRSVLDSANNKKTERRKMLQNERKANKTKASKQAQDFCVSRLTHTNTLI